MEIALPIIPAGIVTLLAFFSPYAVAFIILSRWKAGSKRLVAVVVAIVLALAVTAFYFWMTGDVLPDWPVLILLAFVVGQAAFSLLWKSVKTVEGKHGTTD